MTQCLNSFQVLAIDGWVSCAPLLLVFAEWGAAVCHSFGRLLVPIRSLHLMLMGAACTPSHPKSQVPPWSTLLGSECLVIVPRVAFHCPEIQSTVLLLLQLCLEAAQVPPLVWQVKRGGSVWKTRRERFPLKHTHTHTQSPPYIVCLLVKNCLSFSSMSLSKLKRLDWVEILLEAAWEQSQHFSPNRFSYNFISPTSFFQKSMLLVVFFPVVQYSISSFGHFCTLPEFPFYDNSSP